MATATEKLTAESGKTKAIVAAVTASAVAVPDAEQGGADTGTKVIVWVLVALNIGLAATLGWLQFKRNSDLERNVASMRARIVRTKNDLLNLDSIARTIARDQIREVSEPGSLISQIAAKMEIKDNITVGKAVTTRVPKSNYDETSVKITFLKLEGYQLGDVVRFLRAIEAANPIIQIKDVDFGKRDEALGRDTWRPSNATVRVLSARQS